MPVQASAQVTCIQRVSRTQHGAIAQLGEHLLCKQGVVGSIPTGSTIWQLATLGL